MHFRATTRRGGAGSRIDNDYLPPNWVITGSLTLGLIKSRRDLKLSLKGTLINFIFRPSVYLAPIWWWSLIAFTCQQSLGNGQGSNLLRLSSPRHVTLHKTRETATNFRPQIVLSHWWSITERSIYQNSNARANNVSLQLCQPRALSYVRTKHAWGNVRRAVSHQKYHETAASAVGCKLPSAACGHGTPPRVINPHHHLATLSRQPPPPSFVIPLRVFPTTSQTPPPAATPHADVFSLSPSTCSHPRPLVRARRSFNYPRSTAQFSPPPPSARHHAGCTPIRNSGRTPVD